MVRPQAELRAEIARLEAGGGRGGRSRRCICGWPTCRFARRSPRRSSVCCARRPSRSGPATPRPVLNAFLAFVVAATGMAFLVMARDAMRRRVDSTRELEQLVGAPVIARSARRPRRRRRTARGRGVRRAGPRRGRHLGQPGLRGSRRRPAGPGIRGGRPGRAPRRRRPSPGRRCTIDSGCPWTRGSAACSSVSPRARASARPPCAAHRRPCHGRRAVAAWPS